MYTIQAENMTRFMSHIPKMDRYVEKPNDYSCVHTNYTSTILKTLNLI